MIKACIFDAYGTLFDVAAAARLVASAPGREEFTKHWPQIAETWRLKQLQYTWLRNSMQEHTNFWEVTKDGLDFALEEVGIENDELRGKLLDLYWELPAYPEAAEVLATLKSDGYKVGILSNGSADMLNAAAKSADLTRFLDANLSVDVVQVFKPDNRVYELATQEFNCAPKEILFVSSNGWDAAGSSGFGFQTLWVNRANSPMDRLPFQPWKTINDLTEITSILKEIA